MLDKHSPGVAKVVADLEAEIGRLHVGLERLGKTPSEYDVMRGRIKGLRQAINLIVGDEETEEEVDG